jgi:hypothetical protein
MQLEFDPNKQVDWKAVLAAQPSSGRGLRYVGFMNHRLGGGLGDIFGQLLTILLPVARNVAKNVGREALETGSHILSDIAQNPSADAGEILKTRGLEAVKKVAARKKNKTGTGRKTTYTGRRGKGVGSFKTSVRKPVKRFHVPVF